MADAHRILITGASRGVGAALAVEVASRGYPLALTWRTGERDTLAVARRCNEFGGPQALVYRLDLLDDASIRQFAADFPDFPPPLLDELIADVLRFRRDAREEALQVRPTDRDTTPPFDGPAPPVWIEGRTADLARWLTGRGAVNISASDQSALPTLGPWL